MPLAKPQAPTELTFEQIKRIIPQRFPFLMIDRVMHAEPGVRLVGIKNLTGNEWFYQGHFPQRAVTPGAMLCEAAAQAGIVFFHLSSRIEGEVTYLLGSVKMRFLHPAWPGDQLQTHIKPVKMMSRACVLECEIQVQQKTIAAGELTLAVKDIGAV